MEDSTTTNEQSVSEESFTVAIKSSPHGTILIITDTDLIGTQFEDERLQLDLTKAFYTGEIMPISELPEKIEGSYVLHVTGIKAVAFVKSLGFIGEGKILEIDGVPHAEVHLG